MAYAIPFHAKAGQAPCCKSHERLQSFSERSDTRPLPDPVLSRPVRSRSLDCIFQPEHQTFTPVKKRDLYDDVAVSMDVLRHLNRLPFFIPHGLEGAFRREILLPRPGILGIALFVAPHLGEFQAMQP